jgi:hypothetical protein
MAHQEQLEILMQGAEVWNRWREQNSFYDSHPDLSDAHLKETNLSYANLRGVIGSRSLQVT